MLFELEVPFMRHATVTFVSLAAVSLLVGCPDRSISVVDPEQGRVEFKNIPITPNRNIDILFVVDDSPSMRDKQANLARNFPEFIKVLDSIQGGRPSVHIGVISSDMGSRGADGVIAPGVGSIGKGGCTGLGDGGNLHVGTATLGGGAFISDIVNPMTGQRTQNYTGNLESVLSTMATVGDGGCGFEQHLEAAKIALSGNPANNGFLREEAFLAVIFIADEDDCSMEHTTMLATDAASIATLGPAQSFRCTRFGVTCDQGGSTPNEMNQVGTKRQCHPNESSPYLTNVRDYAAFFKGLKENPNKVIVAGIMGTNEPFATELRVPTSGGPAIPALAHSCTYDGAEGREVADPPTRLRFFLDQFPNRSTFAPICQQDLSGGLQQIGDLLKTVIGNPCIEGKLVDPDPDNGQVDYDCSVSTVIDTGLGPTNEQILPQCNSDTGTPTNAPCWRLVADAAKCPATPEHLILTIEQSSTQPFDLDTFVTANCVTEPR
jgi:hypothetical protein